ncbi:TetR/AcrR family transcriptional regulator [Dactylosporangium matsuzakiense]|uniref:TetR family transcriptional regulator n=1 Tax=Dactylosporangium matsuzakiense TaxID=53360 RepID=A0A9W6KA54_9ACTN|nr:TetR/AcrR family transcriptional regulator [Dactylosporangium matsuzakiense]UWZ47269.1 TetR/AcrR family transcriptional regulator [Dactylosporangium matsuzakiense]GLK98276.1 TetR family transcriptional regulator [Dactylosporangium matsuzakiense]
MALRAEKKAATRTAIAHAATALFMDRGFDRVTVAEIGEAARVSVNTVFNYFATKEDLFFDRQDEVIARLADAVRGAPDPAQAALALFLDELDRGEPTLGLHPDSPRFWKVVDDSPALQARLRLLGEAAEEAVATALIESGRPEPDARWAAAILSGIDRALHAQIRRQIQQRQTIAVVLAEVRDTAKRAYTGASRALR